MNQPLERAKTNLRTAVQAIEDKTEVFLKPGYLSEELMLLLAAMDWIDQAQCGLRGRAAA
jgi:hypothetical protein